MLNQLGRGTAPATKKAPLPFRLFNFASSLPAGVTFTRNSKATCRNANGKLIEVSVNEPRIDHTPDGIPLGLYIEHAATNKCANYNTNPTDTSGVITSGTGSLSVVNDTVELAVAGLDEICTNGQVYRAEATIGTAFNVSISGTTGNTNKHSMSLYARGTGSGGTCGSIGLGGTAFDIAQTGETYQQYKYENVTPSSSAQEFTITVNGNSIVYFILNQLEESESCSSIIPVAGASVTRPIDKAVMDNVDQANWFDTNNGYMICRYTLEKLLSRDVYMVTLNDGSSSDAYGFRMEGASKQLKGFVKAGGSSQHANTNNDVQLANVINSAGVRWNTADIDILSGGSVRNRPMNNLPVGINTLNIGTRNGGSDPIYGHILQIEIGVRDLSLIQLGNKMQSVNDICMPGGGQSLMHGHFSSQENDSNNGKQITRQMIGEAKPNSAFMFLDGSTGGSAAAKTTDATNYWWDNATNTRGPALGTFYNEIDAVGAKPTAILWAQGEDDGHRIDVDTTATQYKAALLSIFNDMRSTYGDIHIYIQKIGRRNGTYSNLGGIQAIRDVQNELIAEYDWCFNAGEVYDQPLFDDVHLSDAGYDETAKRNALAIIDGVGSTGPQMQSASRSGTTVTVTLSHDNGTDFTPTSNIEGFVFFDGTTQIDVMNAVRTHPTTIELTLFSTPSSGIETLYYGYDDMAGLNINNVVTDNATMPMPLRATKIMVN